MKTLRTYSWYSLASFKCDQKGFIFQKWGFKALFSHLYWMVAMETTTVTKILIVNIFKLFKGAKLILLWSDKGRKCYQELKFLISFLFLTTLSGQLSNVAWQAACMSIQKQFLLVTGIKCLSRTQMFIKFWFVLLAGALENIHNQKLFVE